MDLSFADINPNTQNSDAPLVSVIIPCYNYGLFLPETLDNVLAQSCPSWECLIIDNASTDQTKEISLEYQSLDKRFKYLFQPLKGPASARNMGLRQAKGKYIQFLDADDKIENQKLEKQSTYLEMHPEIDIVYSPVSYFQNGNILNHSNEFQLTASGLGLEIINNWLEGQVFVINSPLARRNRLLQDVGFMLENCKGSEDYEFWLRCMVKNLNFQYLPLGQTFALVRKGHHSLMSNLEPMMLGFHYGIRNILKQKLQLSLKLRIKSHYKSQMKFYRKVLLRDIIYGNTLKSLKFSVDCSFKINIVFLGIVFTGLKEISILYFKKFINIPK